MAYRSIDIYAQSSARRPPDALPRLLMPDSIPVGKLDDKYLRLVGIPLVVLAGLLSLMQFYFQGRWDLFWKYVMASLIYATITWESCRWVLIKVRYRIPGLGNTGKRLVLSMIVFLFIAGLGNVVVKWVLQQLNLRPPSMAHRSFFDWWMLNMPSVLFFVVLLSIVYEAIFFFEQYKFSFQKAQQLKKQQARQQLDALKNRVNPHFLFNSLTTLSALIHDDAPKAERFVDELSRVYRYLLRSGAQRQASLGEEMQFARSYTFLLKNRFETGAFSFQAPQLLSEANSAPPPEAALFQNRNIPVLTLQNAIDYLVRTQNAPLNIRVEAQETRLCIACEHQPKTLAFDLADQDWRQLADNGAQQTTTAGQLQIMVPFQTVTR